MRIAPYDENAFTTDRPRGSVSFGETPENPQNPKNAENPKNPGNG
ncbi:hypothetical protein ACWD5R_03105 [Streptomyces sp. NPDC002514]